MCNIFALVVVAVAELLMLHVFCAMRRPHSHLNAFFTLSWLVLLQMIKQICYVGGF